MKPIKVCYLIGSLKVGGAERHVTQLITHMDRATVEPIVVLFQKEGDYVQDVANAQVPIYDLNLKRLYGISMLRGLNRFRSILIQENVDIVHAFIWQANAFAAAASKLFGRRCIISKRNMNDWMSPPYILINRIANRLAHRISVVSNRVAQAVLQREKADPKKLVVIQNGIVLGDPSSHSSSISLREELGLDRDTFLIGNVASLVERKGQRYLLEAFPRIVAEFPKAVLLLIGDGVLRGRLKAYVSQQGLEASVRFLGYRHDMDRILDSLDLFVLSSIEEGMSNALLEAMAHGLPSVVTDVGGNAETIEDGRDGLLVPPRNADLLAQTITRVIRDERLRTQMGRRARQCIEARFSMEAVVRRNVALYMDLLKETR